MGITKNADDGVWVAKSAAMLTDAIAMRQVEGRIP